MAIVLEAQRRQRMSLEEFERIPEGPPFYDYINGEAIEVNKPTGRHQNVEHVLTAALKAAVRPAKSGRVYHNIDVKLPTGNWVGPDIVFIATEHLDRYNEQKGDLYGAPDLAVEVTSPSTESYDRIEKMNEYERAGVLWLWIVQQETLAIEEFQWTPGGYLRVVAAPPGEPFRPKLFPGLELDLQQLLEDLS